MFTANANLLPSERFSVQAVRNPAAHAAATYSTGWVDMSMLGSILALLATGAMTATSTVDAKLEQATSSGGAGVKDITGKAITQLTAAGVDDNKQVMINCRAEELDSRNGFRYVRLTITVATAASILSALLLGLDQRYGPPVNAATVDEIIS